MASQYGRSRAVAAGLSCGFGVAVPALAFAATLPFEDAHALVAACALPFAAGALATVGVSALAQQVSLDRSARAEARERAARQDAVDAAPSFLKSDSERFFGSRRAPKGVPVIARAQGAPSEADAWAEIDSLLDEPSSISCDPRYSKDIYQIAFEELQRTSSFAREGASAAATAASGAPAAQAGPSESSTAGTEETAPIDAEGELDTDAARREALASLDTYDGSPLRTASPASSAAEPLEVISAPVSPATGTAAEAEEVAEVVMRDYSGHEDMWAAAVAILDDADPVLEEGQPVYCAKHMRSASSVTQPTLVPPSPERAAAVDEGARATERHAHVNALIEEEFEQVPSTSVRRTSREYLSVIQGGTASMPRLRAEA